MSPEIYEVKVLACILGTFPWAPLGAIHKLKAREYPLLAQTLLTCKRKSFLKLWNNLWEINRILCFKRNSKVQQLWIYPLGSGCLLFLYSVYFIQITLIYIYVVFWGCNFMLLQSISYHITTLTAAALSLYIALCMLSTGNQNSTVWFHCVFTWFVVFLCFFISHIYPDLLYLGWHLTPPHANLSHPKERRELPFPRSRTLHFFLVWVVFHQVYI